MTNVLRHAKAITHHRDHALVDTALAHSLLDLFDKNSRHFALRIYRVANSEGGRLITLTTWTDGREVKSAEVECDADAAPRQMIDALTLGVATSGVVAEQQRRSLHFTWLPICHGKNLLGCIEIGRTTALAPHQLALVDGIRGLYANYLSLLQYSQTDTLTKLLNRKTFDDSLQQLLTVATAKTLKHPPTERRHEEAEGACWLGVMDIDHFKRINDTFGHLFGDEVLILIANLMRRVFRRKDKLFRFGGEEFVVLLRDTTEGNALKAFERFRQAIEQHEFPQLGRVTISIGLTRVQAFDNPSILLGRADEALYYAKSQGRNQLQLYERLAAEGKVVHAAVVHTEAVLF